MSPKRVKKYWCGLYSCRPAAALWNDVPSVRLFLRKKDAERFYLDVRCVEIREVKRRRDANPIK